MLSPKEKVQGSVNEVGEQAENEQFVPKSGAVGNRQSNIDQMCIFCECCQVKVVAAGEP